MPALQPATITAFVFRPVEPFDNAFFIAKPREYIFQPCEKVLTGTIWGCKSPMNIRLAPTENVTRGRLVENLLKPEFEVPVMAGNMPTWFNAINFESYAALMIPFSEQPPPNPIIRNADEPMSNAEIEAIRQEYLKSFHLVFIDFTPRRTPPPRETRSTEAVPLIGRTAA